MSENTNKRLDRYAAVLRAHGSEPGSSIHSWRCEYPDRYGACDCVAELASDLMAAADAEQAELRAEVERLRKANESLRRQRAKLVNGLLPVSAECPAPGGCGNCALCHRDIARAIVRMTDQRVRDAGLRPMPEGLRDALEKASRAEAAEAERDEVSGRLGAMLCDLTGGRLSKPTYDVPTMVQEIEEHLTRELEIDAEAERDRARSLAATLEARLAQEQAKVARVEALAANWSAQKGTPESDAWTHYVAERITNALSGDYSSEAILNPQGDA